MLRKVAARERYRKDRHGPKSIPSAEAFDKTVDRAILGDLAPPAPFIDRTTKLVTIGSCFAQNIAASLSGKGYAVERVDVIERLFNPFALQAFLEAVARGNDFADFEKHWGVPSETPAALRRTIAEDATVIVTFGLSFVWVDKTTGEMVFDPSRKVGLRLIADDPERFEMQATGVTENMEAMAAIINAIRAIGLKSKIILTLSPVHLSRAICDYPAIPADSISKSTLRCALHEILSLRLKDVYYFPSFEILRWFAPMVDVVFGSASVDILHIHPRWVEYTLSKFRQYYCVGETPIPPPYQPRTLLPV